MSSENLLGKVEYWDNSIVKGWALNRFSPDKPLTISVIDDDTEIEKFTPCLFRWDLKQEGYGRGYHGFVYKIPSKFQDGRPHGLRFAFENGTELERSPVKINNDPESGFVISSAADLTGRKVLALSATPDGGIIGAGGSLALHANSDDPIKIIILSHSSEKEKVDKKKANDAYSTLGIKELEFWNSSSKTFEHEPEDIDKLSKLLSDYKPELIYCPSPHEPGLSNKALANTLWRAIQKSGLSCKVAFAEVNSTIRINTLVDISSIAGQKKEALSLYNGPHLGSDLADMAISLNRFRSKDLPEESLYAEGFFLIDSFFIQSNPIEKFSKDQLFGTAGRNSLKDPPLVSILMRSRNREPLLREALSSVVMQTYPNIEVVLVNDGDNDLSELVDEFRKYIEIQYFNPAERLGLAKGGNLAFRAAKGEYVNILDDDDLYYSNHVSKLVQYLHTTGQDAASTDAELGRYELTEDGFKLIGEPELQPGFEHDPDIMMIWCYVPVVSMMFRKSLLEEIGYMDEEFKVADDWELWVRLLQRVLPKRIPGISAQYRHFADHNYDFTKWRVKVFEKHKQHFENGKIDLSLLNRIDKLVEENGYLRKRLSGEPFYKEYKSPRNQTVWKILYRIKNILPNKVVEYIRSKGFKL